MKESIRMIGNIAIVFILFVILFSYAMFQGGFVSWFLFFSFLPICLYHTGLLLYPLRKWKVTRKMSKQVIQAGDSIQATIKIERKLPFPLYYCVIEEVFPRTLMKVDSRKEKYRFMETPHQLHVERRIKNLSFPWFKRIMELPYTIHQVPRGEHHLSAVRVKTGDIFGFIKKEHIFEVENGIIAHPNKRSLFMAEKVRSFEQGTVSSSVQNLTNTNIAVGVREYIPGDRFSWIDWKQTARKNTMMTKEFEQEKSSRVLLVLDSCSYEGMNPLTFEAAVEITYSLVETFKRSSNEVGLLSIGEQTIFLSTEESTENRKRISQYLTRVQPGGNHPFSVQVKEEMNRIGSGEVVVILTTHIDDFLKQSIQQIQQRTKQTSVIFIQSEAQISKDAYRFIEQLRYANVAVQIITERELVKNPLEVNIR